MNVVFCGTGLTYQADAPFTNLGRANAMVAEGFKVTMVGFPATYPGDTQACRFAYVSAVESQTPAKKQRWLKWKKKLGPYWTHAFEPLLVMRFAFQHAREKGAEVLCIAHAEPWILLFLCQLNKLSRRPVAVVALTTENFLATAGNSLAAKARSWLNQTALRWLPRSCHIICDNALAAQSFKISHYPTVHIVPEGYRDAVQTASQAEARSALGIPAAKRMLLLFGVANRSKGADLLFSAMADLNPQFMLYVVGKTGGVYEASWGPTDELKQSGWGENLQVVPRFVSDQEMELFYTACDGVVLPYRKGFVTTTGGLMKAIEYGKVIIAADQYYMGETVRNKKLGLLFTPEDVPGLRRCLVEFSEKPEAWFEEVRQNSRRLVAEQSWANIGKLYRRLFEQMIAANQPVNPSKANAKQ